MEKNSRTEMLPGKRDFYRCCIECGIAPHTRKTKSSGSNFKITLRLLYGL